MTHYILAPIFTPFPYFIQRTFLDIDFSTSRYNNSFAAINPKEFTTNIWKYPIPCNYQEFSVRALPPESNTSIQLPQTAANRQFPLLSPQSQPTIYTYRHLFVVHTCYQQTTTLSFFFPIYSNLPRIYKVRCVKAWSYTKTLH